MLLGKSESETVQAFFSGVHPSPRSQTWKKEHTPPDCAKRATLVLTEGMGNTAGLQKQSACVPHWAQVGQVKPTLLLLRKCSFS